MNNSSHDTKTFKTSDTPLSAFLVSKGYSPDITFEGTRAFYSFHNTNSKIDKLVEEFDTAQAEGNIVLFFNAYQTLLRRIRERY